MASEDPAEARPSHEVTRAEWEVSSPAAAGFAHLGLAFFFFFYNKGEKMKQVNEHTVRLCFNRNQMSPCPQAGLGSWNCSRGLDAARQDRWTEAARKVGNGCLHLHSGSWCCAGPSFCWPGTGYEQSWPCKSQRKQAGSLVSHTQLSLRKICEEDCCHIERGGKGGRDGGREGKREECQSKRLLVSAT